MHCVYLIQSSKDAVRHYVGYTINLKSRLKEHNIGKSVHTNKFRPWVLKCYFVFNNKKQALDFERYLKSGSGRAFLKRHFL